MKCPQIAPIFYTRLWPDLGLKLSTLRQAYRGTAHIFEVMFVYSSDVPVLPALSELNT